MNAPLPLKTRKCKMCPVRFPLFRSTQVVCSPACAQKHAEVKADKKAAIEAKVARKQYREAKEKIKTARDLVKPAQDAFNAYIRKRDEHLPCISCDRMYIEEIIGGAWDCGHYHSRGARPELRFEELNAHKQCKSCNGGSKKYARKGYTVARDYKERLIARIGQEKVDWLDGPHEAKHYSKEDLMGIRDFYKAKIKQLEKDRQHE